MELSPSAATFQPAGAPTVPYYSHTGLFVFGAGQEKKSDDRQMKEHGKSSSKGGRGGGGSPSSGKGRAHGSK